MVYWHRLYSVLFVLAFRLKLALGQCYFPSGDVAQDHFPCNPYNVASLCCPLGWTCFSGGICVITDLDGYPSDLSLGAAIRGSCTNPKWDPSVCGSVCLNAQQSYDHGQLSSCGNHLWCCAIDVVNSRCNCKTGDGVFPLDSGKAQTIIGVTGNALTKTATALPSSTSILSTTSHSTARPTATSTSSPTSSPTKQATHHTVAFKAGVGVGVALAVTALIFAAVWFIVLRPRRLKRSRNTPPPEYPSPPPIPARSERRKSHVVRDIGAPSSAGVPMRAHGLSPLPTDDLEWPEQFLSPPRQDDVHSAGPPRYSFEPSEYRHL